MIYTLVRRDSGGNVDAVISFDSITSMDESWTAKVSSYTVEKGFDISDNVNVEPTEYSISAVISSYSLFNLDNEIVWNGEDFKSGNNYTIDSHIFARDEIIRIFKEGSVLTLLETTANSANEDLTTKVEELKAGFVNEIENCVMTSLSISHPDSGGAAFYVSIKLQKVVVAVVNTSELADSEMTPAVRPMKGNTDNVSSDTTTEIEDGDTTDMAGAGVIKTEEQVKTKEQVKTEKVAEFKKDDRKTQAQGERIATQKRNYYKDYADAYREVIRLQRKDGISREVVPQGDGWGWRYRR